MARKTWAQIRQEREEAQRQREIVRMIGHLTNFKEQREAGVEMVEPRRTLWYCEAVEVVDGEKIVIGPGGYEEGSQDRVRATGENANLIASALEDGRHAPVLDIDFEARLVPSLTEGHYHLYLDRAMSWPRYRLLLWALKVAGVIEPGFYRASIARRMTMCRWRFNGEATEAARGEQVIGQLYELRDQIASI